MELASSILYRAGAIDQAAAYTSTVDLARRCVVVHSSPAWKCAPALDRDQTSEKWLKRNQDVEFTAEVPRALNDAGRHDQRTSTRRELQTTRRRAPRPSRPRTRRSATAFACPWTAKPRPRRGCATRPERTRGCRRTRKARTTTRIARRRPRRGPTSWTGSSPRCSRTRSTSRRSSRSYGVCPDCWFVVRRRRRSRLATEIVRTKTKVDAYYLDRVL